MKYSIIFLCFIIAHINYGEASPLATKIRQVCQRKVGVSDEDIKKGQKGVLDLSNANLACYMKCVLVKASLMGENGQLTPEDAMKMLPPEAAITFAPAMAGCGFLDDKNSCTKAMKIYQCVYEKFPAAFYLP